ncbi:hypothetical protein [Rhodoferax ferrireducens]|uniref:hypothetical protein n=1 Tax=Rhodoferax ferrireducens TaxID=192843 RepID=UPI000E0D8008|nr:hypothetical protein [Rhodoferax ferrireducens]
MPIHIGHQTRTALVTVGCVGVIGMAGLARAEPMVELTATHIPAFGPVKNVPWWEKEASPALDATDVEGRTNDADDAISAQELLVRNRPAGHSDAGRSERGQAARSLLPAGAQVTGPSTSFAEASGVKEDAAWRAELAHTVLDAVRPAYEGLAGAGVLGAIRDMESGLGLDRGWSFDDALSGNYSPNGGPGSHAESVSWAGSGNRSDTSNRPRSAAQIADDQRNAAVLLEKFIDEIMPWVLALVGVYALGYMVKFSLEYSQWRAVRRRKRSAFSSRQPVRTVRKRHRRHKHRPTV